MPLYLQVPTRRELWLAALARQLPTHAIVDSPAEARYALLWKQPPGSLAHADQLRAIFVLGAGVDASLADPSLSASAPDIPIIRLRDAGMAAQMIDYCVYATLHYQREFDAYARDQLDARWQPRPARARARVGVLGLGELGAAVARALVGLGFPVHGWARSDRSVPGVELHVGPDGLLACLRNADVLLCLLPHTRETAGLLDRSRLRALPRDAAVINVGRGSLIDEAALLELLDEGHLRGAFLDVCASEPLPSAHPLWRHSKVRVTPHIAAETLIEPAVEQLARDIALLESGGLPPLVDRDRGY